MQFFFVSLTILCVTWNRFTGSYFALDKLPTLEINSERNKKTIFVQRWRLESFLMGKSARRSFSCTNFAIRYLLTCASTPPRARDFCLQDCLSVFSARVCSKLGAPRTTDQAILTELQATEQIIWRWIQAGNNTIFSIKYLILNFKNFETLTIYFTNLFIKMTSQNGSTSWNRASVCD